MFSVGTPPRHLPPRHAAVARHGAPRHLLTGAALGTSIDADRLVVVANRLPVCTAGGRVQLSPGGLAAALRSVTHTGSTWIGWSGGDDATVPPEVFGVRLHAVAIDAAQQHDFYDGFCNSVIWPLFHGRLQPLELERTWWDAYVSANRRYAFAVTQQAPLGATVWVHDYHLMLAPALIRATRPDLHIGFFLHTPFPAPQMLGLLPQRQDLLAGLQGADLVGFQTADDADNFARAVERFDPHVRPRCSVGVFPISVDFASWDERGRSAVAAAARIRAELGAQHLILAVDRLDYTKGIRQRIEAFGRVLDDGRLPRDECVLVQIAVPSRGSVDAYRNERHTVECAVSAVNGRHPGRRGVGAVQYRHTSLSPDDLAALYRAADVMAVTPLADGMNLVAKEFVATRGDELGVLVLSEFAGSAGQLGDSALVVNPYDVESLERALTAAVRMAPTERAARMRAMRAEVRGNDVRGWAEGFLGQLACSTTERDAGRIVER